MAQLETPVGTRAEMPEQIGFRNRLRASWHGMPKEQRWAATVGIQLAIAILLWFLDHALGYAALTIAAIYWTRRVPRLPWRLAIEAVVVLAFAIAGPRSLAVLFAIAFALFWAPEDWRGWLIPVAITLTAIFYPFFQDRMFTIPVFGAWPDVATGVYMIVFIMMAVGLNIVVGYAGLLDLGYVAFYATGAYTAAWFASLQFSHRSIHFGAVGLTPPDIPGIHISVWLLLPLAGAFTALCGILIGLPTLRLRGA